MSKKSSATPEKKTAVATADHGQAPVNAALSKEQKIELFRQMVRIRRFEERSLRAYQTKNSQGGSNIGGFLHLYIGQEAVAVGCCSLMEKNDHVITAYRDHGHAIAVGMDTKPLMAELYGKATGCSRGKGGSMHIADIDQGMLGANGIVGGGAPIAVGAAMAAKMDGQGKVSIAFSGDGACNQGTTFEAIRSLGAGVEDLDRPGHLPATVTGAVTSLLMTQ